MEPKTYQKLVFIPAYLVKEAEAGKKESLEKLRQMCVGVELVDPRIIKLLSRDATNG